MSDVEDNGPTPAAVIEIHKQQREIARLNKALAKAEAQREGYREALEKIAYWRDMAGNYARDALAETEDSAYLEAHAKQEARHE